MCCLESLAFDLRKSAQHITPLRTGHCQVKWRVRRRHPCFVEGLNVNVVRTISIYVTRYADLTLHRHGGCSVSDSSLIRARAHILSKIDLVNTRAGGMLYCYGPRDATEAHNRTITTDHRPVVLALQRPYQQVLRVDSILQRRKSPSHRRPAALARPMPLTRR